MSRLSRLLILVVGLAVAFTPLAPTAAAENVRENSSLRFVPADVAFYGSSLRMREQYEAVVNSKAFAQVWENPIVQFAVLAVRSQWESPENEGLQQFKDWYDQQENEQLVGLLLDSVSHEMFAYGGISWAELGAVLERLSNVASARLRSVDPEDRRIAINIIVGLLADNADKLKVPNTAIGFKVTKRQAASAQFKRLKTLAEELVKQEPRLKDRLATEKVGGGEFLTLRLDGSLVPWDQVKDEDLEIEVEGEKVKIDRGQFNRLAAVLKKMTLAVGIGVRDDYLLISLGASTDHLKSLGRGKLLVDRQELAPLKARANERIASISYASADFLRRVTSAQRVADQVMSSIEQALAGAGVQLKEKLRKEMADDVKKLAEDAIKISPQPGAVMGFSFLTPRGYEGYGYNWTAGAALDASKRLTILNYLGGNPLLFAAGRAAFGGEVYGLMAKFVERAVYYSDQIAEDELGEKELADYRRVRKQVTPFARRLDRITREMLIPAFKDGQIAFVMDAKIASKQWHPAMPKAEEALPMLELGVVCGVSDVDLLKKAGAECFMVAQDILDKLHAAEPQKFPEIKLPKPRTEEFAGGTVYSYPLPGQAELDKRIAPNAALADKVAAFTLMPLHSKRLLNKLPPELKGPLSDPNRPLAAASHFNFAGLMDAITPWIDYAIDQADGGPFRPQVHAVLDLFKCYRGYTDATYKEDKAMVTHYEVHIQDLK